MKAGKRRIKYDRTYNAYFTRANRYKSVRVKEGGTVHDTIDAICYIIQNYSDQASKISRKLKGSTKTETAKNIYNFCYSYFQFKEDAFRTDQVRTPNRAFSDRKDGIDCDCFVALIGCMLHQYNWEFIIRMSANYKKESYNHVYIILLDENGKEICIDPVLDQFNNEASYLAKKDKIMEISVLHGLGNPTQRPMPVYNKNISVLDWIKKYELRNHARIRNAIALYSKNNRIRIEETEHIFASLLFKADKKRWINLAKSHTVVKRSKRNFTIRSRDVLVYLGLTNSAQGLVVSLLHDANVLEIWMENTFNLPLASKIAEGILKFKELPEDKTYTEIRRFVQEKETSKPPLTHCHCNKVKSLIYKEDQLSNCLQIAIIVNSAPKGKMIKSVKRMYKPTGSKESNKLHAKLRRAYDLKNRRVANQPLNGFWSTIGTIAGGIIGGPPGAAIGGAIGNGVESATAKKPKGKKPKYEKNETYVFPDGKPYNRELEDENSPSYSARMTRFNKKPYALKVVQKYNEIKAQKGGINPSLSEYNSIISPFIQAEEQRIAEEKRVAREKKAEASRVAREEQKRKKTIKYVAMGTGAAVVLGTGAYFLLKK